MGGVISGYWSMGKLSIHTAPVITNTMDITIAVTGLLIKVLAIIENEMSIILPMISCRDPSCLLKLYCFLLIWEILRVWPGCHPQQFYRLCRCQITLSHSHQWSGQVLLSAGKPAAWALPALNQRLFLFCP